LNRKELPCLFVTHAVKKSLVGAKKNLLKILLNRVPEYPSNLGKR
jgi:hypothetical protein